MVGLAWIVANQPSPVLFVLPNFDLGKSVSETRWEPILRATPCLERLIPTGGKRHGFKVAQQQLGGSTVSFVGSNSPANLASRPVRILILDEVDKFAEDSDKEADAVALAKQRTKSFAHYQHWMASTPTSVDGRIWQSFMSGDLRRYEVPCPHCLKPVVFAWSKQFTLLPITGREAYMTWDQTARREDGSWDLDRVFASAHLVCPHCKGAIRSEHKTVMIRGGTWVPTYPSAVGSKSWHLSSLYANTVQTSFGALALKFLSERVSPQGLKAFIQGELGEPWEDQPEKGQRTEIMLSGEALETPVGDDPQRFLTVDVQAREPFFWWVVREWAKNGNSRLVACGNCDLWEQLAQLQIKHQVKDRNVMIDSGFDTANVYKECLARGQRVDQPGGTAIHHGWSPAKGREKTAGWLDPDTKQPQLWTSVWAALETRGILLGLIQFNKTAMRDILARMRKGDTQIRWELTEAATPEYFAHLDSHVRRLEREGRRMVEVWRLRAQRQGDHLLDCEIMQLVVAMRRHRLPWSYNPRKPVSAPEIQLPTP